jgi:hypothetical protein
VKFNRRELARVVAVVAIIWVAALVLLGKWQQVNRTSGDHPDPALIHYPGFEDVPEQTSANIGWRKYWFELDEEYPSKSVFYFYQRELASRGWRLLGSGEPQWYRQTIKEGAQDVFHAVWRSSDNLFLIQLEMKSVVELIESGDQVVSEERDPTILVYVTLQREVGPGLLTEPHADSAPRIDID